MKKPKPIKPDAPTYFIAKRMERAGMLRPGQAIVLAAAFKGKAFVPKKGKQR